VLHFVREFLAGNKIEVAKGEDGWKVSAQGALAVIALVLLLAHH
jgi:hypothetical protein